MTLVADAFAAGLERGALRGKGWRQAPYPTPGDLYQVLNPDEARRTPALDLIDQQLIDVRDGKQRRLIVTVPPQEGKSQRISRTLPLWLLLGNPDLRIVLVSFEKEIATRWGRQVRTDILGNSGDEDTTDLGLRIRRDTWAADRWQLDGHRGSMTTVGIGGALTGRPADVLIVDDPVKDPQQATSRAYQDRIWDWWTAVARTRLAPGAVVVVVLTRWHESDLAGQLLADEGDGDQWTLLNIPAQSEGDGDPLGRPEGEFLESARGRTVEEWEQIRRGAGEWTWASLYQGRPSPATGGLFKRLWFKRRWIKTTDPWTVGIPERPGPDEDLRIAFRFITVDLAASTRTSADYSVAAAWAVAGTGELLLLDLLRAKVNPEEHWDKVVGPLAHQWRAKIFVEGSQYGTDLVYTAARAGAVVEAVHPDKDKFTRAVPAARRMGQGMILMPPGAHWLDDFIDEAVAFPTAAHDDQVDVLSYAHRVVGEFWVPPESTSARVAQQQPEIVTSAFGQQTTDIASAPL